MPDSATRPTADDDEWEDLLRQWRAQQDTPLRPFFYNRVRARLASEAAVVHHPLHTWLRWPTYAVMLGIILLLSGDGAVAHSAEPAHHPPSSPTDQPIPFPVR
ncbi:hypothetical protein [Hymenobacter weizhouensis]|uniref:hypothetical protein n=1 Tax=Hymenobacter sp. YIM 151500-1 TaxID=2987689 RepID=UPI002227FA5F|nr:hypothetical protein [Hymenobacter sp. YIM 151500-1]UYZ61434.1 hypothetical protein OIS53_10480 [Hymenobacter sp. YIM 151500-1]